MHSVIESGLALHEQIKLRLIRDVLNPATADEEFVKSDRHCAFGQWIYDPNTVRYHGKLEFQRFKAAHRAFHLTAHQALCLARDGSCKAAFEWIQTGPFESASQVLKGCLTALRQSMLCDDPTSGAARPAVAQAALTGS